MQLAAGTGLLNGRSEELLGQFVKELPGSDKQRNSICIATKLAPYPWRITSGISRLPVSRKASMHAKQSESK